MHYNDMVPIVSATRRTPTALLYRNDYTYPSTHMIRSKMVIQMYNYFYKIIILKTLHSNTFFTAATHLHCSGIWMVNWVPMPAQECDYACQLGSRVKLIVLSFFVLHYMFLSM